MQVEVYLGLGAGDWDLTSRTPGDEVLQEFESHPRITFALGYSAVATGRVTPF